MTFDVVVSQEAPLKILAKDLRTLAVNQAKGFPWRIKFAPDNLIRRTVVVEFSQVWLQGSIKSCSGDGDVLTINDGSGDIRVTKCSRAPGFQGPQSLSLSSGSYWAIHACVKLPFKSPPEVEAVKLMQILETRSEAKSMWPLEVQELTDLLRGKVTFNM
ncbi:uncharacterized protein LOC117642146 [Thrips palmi]|uniref:Uncharacterized protein LOC117642146 n=1 Tax=Thrips palmi TaxID=161013 RepID=A0A6P8Y8H8_THRPL|nr:uncharacterized protein LOC117642146 [Thrips palmi]